MRRLFETIASSTKRQQRGKLTPLQEELKLAHVALLQQHEEAGLQQERATERDREVAQLRQMAESEAQEIIRLRHANKMASQQHAQSTVRLQANLESENEEMAALRRETASWQQAHAEADEHVQCLTQAAQQRETEHALMAAEVLELRQVVARTVAAEAASEGRQEAEMRLEFQTSNDMLRSLQREHQANVNKQQEVNAEQHLALQVSEAETQRLQATLHELRVFPVAAAAAQPGGFSGLLNNAGGSARDAPAVESSDMTARQLLLVEARRPALAKQRARRSSRRAVSASATPTRICGHPVFDAGIEHGRDMELELERQHLLVADAVRTATSSSSDRAMPDGGQEWRCETEDRVGALASLVRCRSHGEDEGVHLQLRTELARVRTEAAESAAAAERLHGLVSLQVTLHSLTADELEDVTGSFASRLGTGSFGDVFAGRVSAGDWAPEGGSDEVEVAVKVPPTEVACSSDTSSKRVDEQFLRELRVGAIRDEHLVPILAVCLEARAIIYPRARRTLEDHLRERDWLTPVPAEGLQWLTCVANGLLALHDRGIVHRDVKSANILLFPATGDSVVAKLGDSGWAREVGGATVSCVGTAAYLDPEALALGCCSAASDLFSFGVVVLEVLLRRSVTEPRFGDVRPLWRQLNEALPRVCEGLSSVAAAAVAYVRASISMEGWHLQALESVVMLVVDLLKESVTQPRAVDRPSAAATLSRLQLARDLLLQQPLAQAPPIEQAAPLLADAERCCSVCLELPITVRLRPCCHSPLCVECAPGFIGGLCPLCRCEVTSFETGMFEATFAPQ